THAGERGQRRHKHNCSVMEAHTPIVPFEGAAPLSYARRMRAILMMSLLGLFGCGKAAPPANPLAFSIDTPPYTVHSAEGKRYYCYTTRLAADQDRFITQIMPVYGRATHHLGVYYTLADEPDGVFDCPELVRRTWIPLYGGGVQSGTVKVPDGAAFHLN